MGCSTPIHRCSRRLVPALERAGYQMGYHEFAGGHTVPPAIAEEAFEWLRAGAGSPDPAAS
jgi:phospholipase/carboxylesterase